MFRVHSLADKSIPKSLELRDSPLLTNIMCCEIGCAAEALDWPAGCQYGMVMLSWPWKWKSLMTCSMDCMGRTTSQSIHKSLLPSDPPLLANIASLEISLIYCSGSRRGAGQQYGMTVLPWTLTSLWNCSIVFLGPMGNFTQHTQVCKTKGSTTTCHINVFGDWPHCAGCDDGPAGLRTLL